MSSIEFNTVEIESNIQKLRDYFFIISNDSRYHQNKLKKFKNWVKQLDFILRQIKIFDADVLPRIENDLGYPLTNRNLVITALFQPSAKKIFSEIKKEFNSTLDLIVPKQDLDLLEICSDRANSLAWIGDVAIKYAISSKIWKLDTFTEELNDTRKMCESNENLSRLCGKWQLFESRINLDPEDEKLKSANKIKGTLVESVFGIIFVAKGIECVQNAVHLIRQQ